jgi:histidinol-phosphate aminotransferase
MFGGRLTERAKIVINYAGEEAIKYNQAIIEPEFLLLGLLHEGQGIAARALIELGVNLEKLESEIRPSIKSLATSTNSTQPIEYSQSAKLVLQYAMEEAHRMEFDNVGTEHILLGLIREKDSIAGKVLEKIGVTLDKVLRMLRFFPTNQAQKSSSRKEQLAKDGVMTISPYEPGKPIEEVSRELGIPEADIIKMASNENPLGASPLGVQAIKDCAEMVNLYPDGDCYSLKLDLAELLGVNPQNILMGNGSNDVLQIIADTFINPVDEVIYSRHAFVVYTLVTKVADAKAVITEMKDYAHDLDAMADAITEMTKVIFIANPNNPTGTMVTTEQVEQFMKRVPDDVIVVFDEAYYEYVTRDDYPQTIKYVNEGRNVIVCRTFSKIYGLAGLRVGYGIAKPELVEVMNKVRQPFNVSMVAQSAAIASLKDRDHVEKSIKVNIEGKEYLYDELKKIGLDYVPSEANFILVHLDSPGPQVMKEMLKYGVIVRPLVGYELPNSIRVTIGTREQNERFISSLKAVLGK